MTCGKYKNRHSIEILMPFINIHHILCVCVFFNNFFEENEESNTEIKVVLGLNTIPLKGLSDWS